MDIFQTPLLPMVFTRRLLSEICSVGLMSHLFTSCLYSILACDTSLSKNGNGSHHISTSRTSYSNRKSTRFARFVRVCGLLSCRFRSRNMIPFFEREVFTNAKLRKNRYIALIFYDIYCIAAQSFHAGCLTFQSECYTNSACRSC